MMIDQMGEDVRSVGRFDIALFRLHCLEMDSPVLAPIIGWPAGNRTRRPRAPAPAPRHTWTAPRGRGAAGPAARGGAGGGARAGCADRSDHLPERPYRRLGSRKTLP